MASLNELSGGRSILALSLDEVHGGKDTYNVVLGACAIPAEKRPSEEFFQEDTIGKHKYYLENTAEEREHARLVSFHLRKQAHRYGYNKVELRMLDYANEAKVFESEELKSFDDLLVNWRCLDTERAEKIAILMKKVTVTKWKMAKGWQTDMSKEFRTKFNWSFHDEDEKTKPSHPGGKKR